MKDLFRLLSLFRPYWRWGVLGVFAAFATLIANVGLMAVSGWFISAMAIAGATGVSINYFTPAAIIRACAIIRTGGRYAERLITHEATFRLLAGLRCWFYEHLEPLAPARLQQIHSGDLFSRIRADIDTLENLYLRILAPVIVAFLSTCLFVVFLYFYHPLLALLELTLLLLAGVAVPVTVNWRAKNLGRRIVETSSELRVSLVDGLQGLGELLVYDAAQAKTENLSTLSNQLIRDQGRMSGLAGVSQGMLFLCANLAMWLVVIIVIPEIDDGRMPPANLAMLALFVLASFEAVLPLPLALQSLGETLTAARRIFSVIDARPAVANPGHPSPSPSDFRFRMDKVSFRYQNDGPDVLRDISLELSYGDKLAVIGSTGSGKSTLINLLLQFWAPTAGRIELGGYPLESFHGEDVRRYFAVVPQHTHMFNTTIRGNLLLANPKASQNQIEHVCRIAQIHDFIVAQPQAYATYTGEAGLRLSGGQARRLAIARALLKDAPILILDEPGEGLDAVTEHALLDAVLEHSKNRTVLLITHRLTGLESMDQIIALDRGRIVPRSHIHA